MPDAPHPAILDVSIELQIRGHLREPLEVLEDMAQYGSHLIIRVWDNTPKLMADVVMVDHLLRLVVMHLDGLRALLKIGAGPTALLQLRSLLEASLLLDWVAKADSEAKATYLLVSTWRKRRQLAEAFIPGTPANADFLAAIPGSKITPAQEAQARSEFSEVDRILAQSELAPVNAAIAALATTHDPDWTDAYHRTAQIAAGVARPRKFSIRALADDVGRLREYRYFYSKLSNDAHGSALGGSVTFKGGGVFTNNVRLMNEFSWTFTTATTLALRAYRLILQRYRPGEDSLERAYSERWRQIIRRRWVVTHSSRK